MVAGIAERVSCIHSAMLRSEWEALQVSEGTDTVAQSS
jgi:hypothetical protein